MNFDEETLARMTDISKVRKAYKLGPPPKIDNSKQIRQETKEMEVVVLGMMALRGAT